jgi:hypothetical protein
LSETVLVSLISSSSAALVAIAALVLNYRGFTSIERRLERLEDRMNTLGEKLNDLDKRLTRVEEGLAVRK